MEKITLPNGARILTERTDFLKSATFGVWIGTGSRHETAALSGASHFIEHMLFKGTAKHDCAALSEALDLLGGHSNAYTTKEITSFYVRALSDRMTDAVELVSEMLFSSLFDPADLENERGVIEEEIGMYEDDPEDLATEKLSEIVYPSSSLGRPILGTVRSLRRLDREALLSYMHSHYTGANAVAALSGNFDRAAVDLLAEKLSALPCGKRSAVREAVYVPGVFLKKKKYEQNHIGLLWKGFGQEDERRYAAALLSAILGGGASSRLFRRVRDEEGLCYAIYSFSGSTEKEGLFGVYAACSRENEKKALETAVREIVRIREEGVSREELERAKEKNRTSLLLSMESTGSRASYMARNELKRGTVPSFEEVLAAYDRVSEEEIRETAGEILRPEMLSFAAVGRIGEKDYYEELLRK
ncbi:MAG: insulinase family protein [Clostridia bacterium]|nr:insulinase family protein [Clostridia bacterium]